MLHQFDKSMHGQQILPTLTHLFLQALIQNRKLTKLLTQNIDDLELDAGMKDVLKSDLMQIHGSFQQPPICINQNCPCISLVQQLREKNYYSHNNLANIFLNINELLINISNDVVR